VKVVHALLEFSPQGHEYRVILMKRPLDEVIESQRLMLERSGKFGAAISPGRVAEACQRRLTHLERQVRSRARTQLRCVNYHDCLHRPLEVALELPSFLGLPLDPLRMQAVLDSSLYRNRTKTLHTAV
jgi:hypothetical protein